jgi:hypothetical protein
MTLRHVCANSQLNSRLALQYNADISALGDVAQTPNGQCGGRSVGVWSGGCDYLLLLAARKLLYCSTLAASSSE